MDAELVVSTAIPFCLRGALRKWVLGHSDRHDQDHARDGYHIADRDSAGGQHEQLVVRPERDRRARGERHRIGIGGAIQRVGAGSDLDRPGLAGEQARGRIPTFEGRGQRQVCFRGS